MVSPQSGSELDFSHPHAAGLVGCWPLVAGMGTFVEDHSGNGYHGTLTNMAGTEWVPSPYGWALNFPGTDDYVGVAGTSPLLKITGSMTCAALFLMPAAPAAPHVLCKTVSAYTYLLGISGGGSQTFSFRTTLGNVTGPGGAGGLTPYVGKWILLAGRYDGAYQQVSVVKEGLITSWGSALSGAITANNDAFAIGNRAGTTNALLSPIVCAWVWDRYKTDRTLVELWERPWDMWSRPRRLWYVPTSGAQTASVNAATRTAQAFAPTAIPGAVIVSPDLAARVAAAFAPAASPGAVTTSPAIAARTAIAFEAGATPGTVTALAGLASRIAAAFEASGLPGSVTILPGVSARAAQAFAASASVGAATVYPGSIARTAVAFAPSASGGTVSVDAGFAARVAAAFAAVASTSSAATGMRDTLVLVDLRDGLLLVDLRDVLNLQ